MELRATHKKQLKKLGHNLKPYITIGKFDLSHNVINSIERELKNHELIKIRILNNSSENPKNIANIIADKIGANIIRVIGNTILIYKQNPDENERKIHFS